MKHLLIDFENVQPQNLDKLAAEDTHIWLFLGVNHKMLPISLVQSLLRFGERVHLVQLQRTGKNALDFYLSYYLGQITATDPSAQIGILSRDGGYDVLVEHILANRHAQDILRLADIDEVQHRHINAPADSALIEVNLDQITENTPKPQQPLAPYFQAALTALRKPDAYRPRHLHNLQSNLRKYVLHDLFADKTEAERETTTIAVTNKLKAQKLTIVDEQGMVAYHLSDTDLLQRIQRYILSVRPASYADFAAMVQNRAEALALTVSQSDIQALARHLREQNLIRQSNGKIKYAPFKTEPTQPKQPEKEVWQPDEAVWKKITAVLSLAKAKRPKTVTALCNTIKSHAKSDTQQTPGGTPFVFPENEMPKTTKARFEALGASAMGVPMSEFLKLTKIPIVLYYGDYIQVGSDNVGEGKWGTELEMAKQFVATVNKYGGDATLIHLPEIGIKGNSHFLMGEKNNAQLADLMAEWLKQKGLDK